jgi:succinate dehydrogenase hydrophobic anchor subunit
MAGVQEPSTQTSHRSKAAVALRALTWLAMVLLLTVSALILLFMFANQVASALGVTDYVAQVALGVAGIAFASYVAVRLFKSRSRSDRQRWVLWMLLAQPTFAAFEIWSIVAFVAPSFHVV